MSTILLGTNRFDDCETLITFRNRPVLSVDMVDSVPTVRFQSPEGAIENLEIVDNSVRTGNAHVVSAPNVLSILHGVTPILHAAAVEQGIVVALDLRPLGLAIYTDATGLHVGSSVVSGNEVRGARVAIALQ